jgi:Flp pilus assembly protein TadG
MVRLKKFVQGAEGSIMVLTALGLVAFLGLASLAVDMGHLYVVRNELQNTADAAALAGASNLVKQENGEAVRDPEGAQQAVMTVLQRQSEIWGQTTVEPDGRNDVNVTFGEWNIYAGNPDTAWTDLGSSCGAYSNANGVRVTIRRASGLAYGPVTNFLAGIFGSQFQTSEVAASATAFLGFVTGTQTGSVTLPLAIPSTVLTAAHEGDKSWFASLWETRQAVATAPKQLTFKDLGSDSFYANNLGKPLFDTEKGYLVTVVTSDPLPGTVIDNIEYTYKTSGVKPIRPMEVGTRLYPLSEYKWASNIKTIFNTFKQAYTANKDSNGHWQVLVPVYGPMETAADRLNQGLRHMARFFSFGPSPAHACFTFYNQTYPGGNVPIEVKGFANVDVVDVTYNSTCNTCSTYTPYADTTDCLVNNPDSCRNTNSVTIEIPVSSSTVSPPGTSSGGPDNQHIITGGESNTGALAAIPRLVK